MIPYKHTQTGILMLVLMPAVGLVGVLPMYFVAPRDALTGFVWTVAVALPLAIMGLVTLLFYRLTVEVDDTELRFRFGIGLIRKRYPVADIIACRPVKNRVLYGWGIKLTPHGWLYNVSGLDAVEIEFGNGKKIRLGTDEPAQLTRAIEAALGVKEEA